MTVQDKRNSDFAAMPPGEQPLRIVMVDSHDAVERGGAVHEALAPVRRHRSALQRGARKAHNMHRGI